MTVGDLHEMFREEAESEVLILTIANLSQMISQCLSLHITDEIHAIYTFKASDGATDLNQAILRALCWCRTSSSCKLDTTQAWMWVSQVQ